jgi:hypothetical protein
MILGPDTVSGKATGGTDPSSTTTISYLFAGKSWRPSEKSVSTTLQGRFRVGTITLKSKSIKSKLLMALFSGD